MYHMEDRGQNLFRYMVRHGLDRGDTAAFSEGQDTDAHTLGMEDLRMNKRLVWRARVARWVGRLTGRIPALRSIAETLNGRAVSR